MTINQAFEITMIPIQQFDRMMQAADNGDKQAQRCAIAFADWSKRVEAQAENGAHPACFQCEATIVALQDGGHGIGGFALICPTKLDANAEIPQTAMVAVFCPVCERLGRDALMAKLLEAIESDIGLAVVSLQSRSETTYA
jgi:hypothetical protein